MLPSDGWAILMERGCWVLFHTHTHTHARRERQTETHTSCSVADILLFSPLIGPLGVVRGLSGCLQRGNAHAHTHTNTNTCVRWRTHMHSYASGKVGNGVNRGGEALWLSPEGHVHLSLFVETKEERLERKYHIGPSFCSGLLKRVYLMCPDCLNNYHFRHIGSYRPPMFSWKDHGIVWLQPIHGMCGAL